MVHKGFAQALTVSAALISLSLPGIGRATDFTLTVAPFDSPHYTNVDGTFFFTDAGRPNFLNASISLTPGLLDTVPIDSSTSGYFEPSPVNSNTTVLFSGDASGLMTLNGVSHILTHPYVLDTRGEKSAQYGNYSEGVPVVFDFGDQTVTVVPIASFPIRQATFLLTPTQSAVPEPSSVTLMAIGGLGLLRLRHRRL